MSSNGRADRHRREQRQLPQPRARVQGQAPSEVSGLVKKIRSGTEAAAAGALADAFRAGVAPPALAWLVAALDRTVILAALNGGGIHRFAGDETASALTSATAAAADDEAPGALGATRALGFLVARDPEATPAVTRAWDSHAWRTPKHRRTLSREILGRVLAADDGAALAAAVLPHLPADDVAGAQREWAKLAGLGDILDGLYGRGFAEVFRRTARSDDRDVSTGRYAAALIGAVARHEARPLLPLLDGTFHVVAASAARLATSDPAVLQAAATLAADAYGGPGREPDTYALAMYGLDDFLDAAELLVTS